MSEVVKELVTSLIAGWALGEGFVRGTTDLVRKRREFIDCISIQVAGNGAQVALNVGTHPAFLAEADGLSADALHEFSEVDCYIRKRLAPNDEADFWIPVGSAGATLAAELKALFDMAGAPFFERFSSIGFLIESLTVENISTQALPDCFGMLTRSRLALLGAKANMEIGDVAAARDLAEYGLSVCGMAVALKREFKKILSCS